MFLKAWLDLQVPEPADSLIVPVDVDPSPQVIVHVCVSAVPASVNDALNDTVAPALKIVPANGLVIVTAGGTFETVTAKVLLAEAPVPSGTLSVAVDGVVRALAYVCTAE